MIKLPPLQSGFRIVTPDGVPTNEFQTYWNTVLGSVEELDATAIYDAIDVVLAAAVAAQSSADAAQTDADTAQATANTALADAAAAQSDADTANAAIAALPAFASGTYNPTGSNTLNTSATSSYGSFLWSRQGDMVHVSGCYSVTSAVAGGQTGLDITLPVASNLAAFQDLIGNVTSNVGIAGAVFGETTNDRARIRFASIDTVARDIYIAFTYRVLP